MADMRIINTTAVDTTPPVITFETLTAEIRAMIFKTCIDSQVKLIFHLDWYSRPRVCLGSQGPHRLSCCSRVFSSPVAFINKSLRVEYLKVLLLSYEFGVATADSMHSFPRWVSLGGIPATAVSMESHIRYLSVGGLGYSDTAALYKIVGQCRNLRRLTLRCGAGMKMDIEEIIRVRELEVLRDVIRGLSLLKSVEFHLWECSQPQPWKKINRLEDWLMDETGDKLEEMD